MTRVLALTRYESQGASSRVRLYQYLPALVAAGLEVTSAPLLRNADLAQRYATGRYASAEVLRAYTRRLRRLLTSDAYDLLWIQQELWPWMPAALERALLRGRRYVLDYDDALFHAYDQHPSPIVRRVFGQKVAHLVRGAALVVAGNPYLAAYARRAGAAHVEVVPSVVDTNVLGPVRPPPEGPFTIGWIGSPGSERLLEPLRPVLAPLLEGDAPAARLVLVGATENALAGLPHEVRPWRETTEAAEIDRFHVGIMPLQDTPWECGKCGYKLVQYMARARPVVASPVGVNVDLVDEGKTGFLADTPQAWHAAFNVLRSDPARARALGEAGRRRVKAAYDVAVTAPRLATLLHEAATSPV